ncbi:MAG TPA: endolytic transglycosylase MltG [Alphaproteobacteria bacterium]|nr:endolytic transglycosylase MltG [Alphaproteobacteria bacterium]
MLRRLLKAFLILTTAAAIALAAVTIWSYARFTRPGPAQHDITVVLPRGTGVLGIAGRLEHAGVISSAWLFALAVELNGVEHMLQAGEYRFPGGASMREAMALIVSGKTVVRRLTVAEGLTTAQVLDLLDATDGLEGRIAERPPEGSLLPETYHFSYGDSRQGMVERMQRAMRETLDRLWRKRRADLPLKTKQQALTLASIVEKETAVPHERPHIAGVFLNRLRRGMPLQSDPTVAYALTGGKVPLDRALASADLKTDSPYNTYVSRGLPPGPIANPGRESIAAVLQPLDTDDLYFVADGGGGHAFARTFQEHLRNVQRWRKVEREGRDGTEGAAQPAAR